MCCADVSDQIDPDTANEADYMTPAERFQRNLGVFSSKERVPPLVLESGANGSLGQDSGDQGHDQVQFLRAWCP